MKKKILLLVLFVLVFSLTGCDAKYKMQIKDSRITEDISFIIPNNYDETSINELIDYYGVNSDSSFTEKITKGDTETEVSLNGKTTKIDTYFNNSDSFINKCYNKVSFVTEDGKYYIGTSTGFKCLSYDYMELDSVTISIKSYYKVYENNADMIKDNVYTWNIDRDNVLNQSIVFVVSKSEYIWYYKYRYLIWGSISVAVLFLITYLVISMFKISSKRANKI